MFPNVSPRRVRRTPAAVWQALKKALEVDCSALEAGGRIGKAEPELEQIKNELRQRRPRPFSTGNELVYGVDEKTDALILRAAAILRNQVVVIGGFGAQLVGDFRHACALYLSLARGEPPAPRARPPPAHGPCSPPSAPTLTRPCIRHRVDDRPGKGGDGPCRLPRHARLLHRGVHTPMLLKARMEEFVGGIFGGGARISRAGSHVAGGGGPSLASIGEHADAGGDPDYLMRAVRAPSPSVPAAPEPAAPPGGPTTDRTPPPPPDVRRMA